MTPELVYPVVHKNLEEMLMNINEARKKIDQLTEAFQRQGLQLEQTTKMLDQYKRQLSELESVIIKARNALTPRGMVKMSCEREGIEVMSLSGEKKIVMGERDVPDQEQD